MESVGKLQELKPAINLAACLENIFLQSVIGFCLVHTNQTSNEMMLDVKSRSCSHIFC